MPKYYIQSGTVRLVTTAANSSGAAIWAVHRTLSQSLPFLRDTEAEETPLPPDTRSPSDAPRLAETMFVSEQGFDRTDAQLFDTLDMVTEWNQLLVAIDRLQKRLAEA